MLPKSKDEKNLTKFHMYISTHDAAGAIVLGVPHKQPRGAPRMTYGIWLLCQQDSRFFLPRPQQVARARRDCLAWRAMLDTLLQSGQPPPPRAAFDPRRPAHSAHTAQAVYGDGHQRHHPELATSTRLGVKKKDVQLKS